MAQENLEIVRELYQAVNSSGLEALAEYAHPEIEVIPPPEWPEASPRRGLEAVRAGARQWVEAFEGFSVEPERFVDSGGARVLVYVRDRGRIKGSAAEIDTHLIHVWTLKSGKVLKWEVFADESQALEAAGLTA
jgi:uncharacterized protein